MVETHLCTCEAEVLKAGPRDLLQLNRPGLLVKRQLPRLYPDNSNSHLLNMYYALATILSAFFTS